MKAPGRSPGARLRAGLLLGSVALTAPGCGRGEPPAGEGTAAFSRSAAAEAAALGGVATAPVQGWTGPGGQPFSVALRSGGGATHLYRRIGTRSFSLPFRTEGLAPTRGACSSCHQGRALPAGGPDVHRNVVAVHPAATGARCSTCHLPDGVDRLALEEGEEAGLDHAYRLCARCHFAQVDAWAAGVHGKRLDRWQGERVVMGCVDCHDPHRPVTPVRIPFPGPRLPATGGRP